MGVTDLSLDEIGPANFDQEGGRDISDEDDTGGDV